jgi:hypothetical protein
MNERRSLGQLLDDLTGVFDAASSACGSLPPSECDARREELESIKTDLLRVLYATEAFVRDASMPQGRKVRHEVSGYEFVEEIVAQWWNNYHGKWPGALTFATVAQGVLPASVQQRLLGEEGSAICKQIQIALLNLGFTRKCVSMGSTPLRTWVWYPPSAKE